jgi:rubredoxin
MEQSLTSSEKLKRNKINMETFKCVVCGFIYNPEEGDSENGIEPGISFYELPADYACPICGAGKEDFMLNE